MDEDAVANYFHGILHRQLFTVCCDIVQISVVLEPITNREYSLGSQPSIGLFEAN